ncbi:MAG: response regulator transcription factor [Actinomycetota bacterium]|nr:response regulator transcription factor [Actinomycetota bacterium]
MKRKTSVLLVEDDLLMTEIVKKTLLLEGYNVEAAASGEEGLEKLRRTNPDLVLLDVLLPNIDGWEFLTRMRSDAEYSEVPVIFLSALTDEKSKVQGLRGGADDYITKPFSSLELVARIEAVLKRSEKSTPQKPILGKIAVRKAEKILLINIDEITFANTHKDYTYINTMDERLLTDYSMSQLEKILNSGKFFRAHRGFIVNLNRVKEINRLGAGTLELVLNDSRETKIPVSTRQSAKLRKMLNI